MCRQWVSNPNHQLSAVEALRDGGCVGALLGAHEFTQIPIMERITACRSVAFGYLHDFAELSSEILSHDSQTQAGRLLQFWIRLCTIQSHRLCISAVEFLAIHEHLQLRLVLYEPGKPVPLESLSDGDLGRGPQVCMVTGAGLSSAHLPQDLADARQA